MRQISLSLKITISFIILLTTILISLYYIFYNMAYDRMLKSEEEKVTLIAQTIEPMIGMDYYLGLNEEIIILVKNTAKNPLINTVGVNIEDKDIYSVSYEEDPDHIHVSYPIHDPILGKEIGYLDISYKLDSFNKSFQEIKTKIIEYLLLMGMTFIAFSFFTQYLLKPLGEIAQKVKDYKIGSDIDFKSIRSEVETNAIVDAFKKMTANIKEHNIMLERYKYAIDESAIVSRTDLEGKITYVNDEFCKVSGYSYNELIGQSHRLIRHPDMNSETFKNIWETLNDKRTWKGVIKNKNKDGLPYYAKSIIVPIFDENMNTVEYIGITHDITKIVQQQEQIARQTTDTLTGLSNKIKLEEDIKALKFPKLALIELDNFYVIEDYYGDEVSKSTIKETSELLSSLIEPYDIDIYKSALAQFGFLGGDNISIDEFTSICHNILKNIDDHTIVAGDESFNIHATGGFTYLSPKTYSNALIALHHSKDTKKHFAVYEETDNIIEYYENNLKWTKDLKKALADNRIAVFVQPIYEAKQLKLNKYECLVRMISEDGSIIAPFFFLDIAKKSRLYLQVTKRVISISFEIFSKLPDKTFSINLSVEDLSNKDSMKFLKDKILEYDIASQLILEIVESEGIENYDETIKIISELKTLGCQISIDDFGSGYSNFAYLMELNVDCIKIDGSLIKTMDQDKNSKIITSTILDFSRQLEITTVAEFVHNQAVLDSVRNMGIDYVQGFYLGEPEPIESLVI